jgi:Tfp pilus assembly pilus retraction ATPase PilT
MEIVRATRVRDLELCDLYLGHPNLEARYCRTPGMALGPVPADAALRDDLGRLAVLCDAAAQSAPAHAAFKVRHDAVSYRCVAVAAGGGMVFLLRRLAEAVGTLAGLGMPQAYARRMLTRYLSGLFIICGEARSGRTTTACAMLKERLLAHGGLALTGEDPIELPLEGEHGNGICFQTTVPRDPLRFGDAFNRLLRAGAGNILIDEISSPEAAAAVLQASVGGPLLVATMQAEDVVQCLVKLHALASERLAPENARALLAAGLTGVLHQQMTMVLKSRLKMEAELLYLTDEPVPRTLLRKGEYEHLESMLRQQRAAMIAESATVSRFAQD